MNTKKRIGALLLLGGTGKRFGSDIPKQFHRLAGKPVFLYALETFLSLNRFDEIILSCHPEKIDEVIRLTKSFPNVSVTTGGETRQLSSYRGLKAFRNKPDIVLIHDAVRPLIDGGIILRNLEAVEETGAVNTCIPSTDTIVHSEKGDYVSEIPDRARYLRGQTPQTFFYPLILRAHETTGRTDVSDDCRLIAELGHPIRIVSGNDRNLKITSASDLILAEQLLHLRIPQKSENKENFEGRLFAVVGGTGGIGSVIAERLEARGGRAILLSRRTSPPLDLCRPESILEAFDFLARSFGPLDGLINCAGYLSVAPLRDLSLRHINELLDINLKGLILCCKEAPLKKGAHVINMASSSFSKGRKDISIYACAKAGVVNFTQGWAEERPDLRIHTVIPQRTDTPLRKINFPAEDPSSLLHPEEIAEAVLQLLSEKEMTGLTLEVRKK